MLIAMTLTEQHTYSCILLAIIIIIYHNWVLLYGVFLVWYSLGDIPKKDFLIIALALINFLA